MKKIVIAGGTGFLGSCIIKHFINTDAKIIVLSRQKPGDHDNIHYEHWDCKSQGKWSGVLEGADAVINFNGKSVDCRYTEKNKKLIYSSRLEPTAALGTAIQNCKQPPALWINAASSTIYRHSVDKQMDEVTGEIGTGFSIDVCQQWEKIFNDFTLPSTRKVLLRTAIVLGKNGGAFQPLKMLAKLGVGGRQGSGQQYISWIHEKDFVQIVEFILHHPEISGVCNVTSPHPSTNREVMKSIRNAVQMPLGIPMPTWLLEFGSLIIRTETELVLKSRNVVPKRLLDAGYKFEFVDLDTAIKDLVG